MKFLALTLLFTLLATPVLADTSQSSISPKATRASNDDTNFHLDLSAGLTTEHGNNGQVDAVYNYGAVLFKNLTPKLKVYFYGGDQMESEKVTPAVIQPVYGSFVYNTGLVYKINPIFTVTGSYDQSLGHNYRTTGETIYHQINFETMMHVF